MKKLISVFAFAIFSSTSFAQTVPSAESILSAAYKKATKEKKNVFVIFHASWCGWCKKLDASMNDSSTKKYFDNSYVTVHLTVDEQGVKKKLINQGAEELLTKYGGDQAGLPFFVIQDKKGKELANSYENSKSLGCPSERLEVGTFIQLLQRTSKINEQMMKIVYARFIKNQEKE
jgi:thioredoxin-related protein